MMSECKTKTWSNLSLQEGNLAENFKEWIQSFELYLTATGIEEKAEKVQVATFLHVAGPDAQRVYNTFNIVADDTIIGRKLMY